MLKVFGGALAIGVGVVLLLHGTAEPGVREVIRWTARCSLCLLCLALATDGLSFGRRHRSDLLRGLALSHIVHAAAVATLAVYTQGSNLLERSAPVDVLGGVLAYVFILWGALRPGSRLISPGLFWIWGVFMVGYGSRAVRMPMPFGLAVALLVVAMSMRLSTLFKAGPSSAETSSPP